MSLESPVLKIGVTLASFSLHGKMPVVKDRLKIWHSGSLICIITDLIIFGLMSSRPAAVFLKEPNILWISKGEVGFKT